MREKEGLDFFSEASQYNVVAKATNLEDSRYLYVCIGIFKFQLESVSIDSLVVHFMLDNLTLLGFLDLKGWRLQY